MTTNEWDEYATEWDSNPDVRAYSILAFDSWNKKIRPLIPDLANCRVLDFGCGTGLLSELLAPFCGQIVAVDTSAQMIGTLQQKITDADVSNIVALQISVNAESIKRTPELAGKFDCVAASSVCSFLPDYEGTLKDIVSAIRTGGCFVQWDWLADMPEDRIRRAFVAARLSLVDVGEEFSMNTEKEAMPVVIGIGQPDS